MPLTSTSVLTPLTNIINIGININPHWPLYEVTRLQSCPIRNRQQHASHPSQPCTSQLTQTSKSTSSPTSFPTQPNRLITRNVLNSPCIPSFSHSQGAYSANLSSQHNEIRSNPAAPIHADDRIFHGVDMTCWTSDGSECGGESDITCSPDTEAEAEAHP